jgi:WD40 repeat protein
LQQFTTFGDLLKFLRRRAGLTQRELSIAVGYSNTQICRLEQNQRLPDLATLGDRFVPKLGLEDDPAAVQRLIELAAAVRREDAPANGLSPYKGLLHFDETDSELFFGREALIARLAARLLAAAATQARFLAVLGASGSGKSSLLRAGLIPALRWSPAAAGWLVHVLTPTAHPLEALAHSLRGEARSAASPALAALAHSTTALDEALRQQTQLARTPHAVLLVDQFEELFTLCRDEAERRAFVGNLMVAAGCEPQAAIGPAVEPGPAIVVIALRADFYAPCAAYSALRQALAQQQEYIGSMTAGELRAVIEKPARHEHWELEAGLVDRLLADVGADGERPPEPGALPLLSHALLETWQRRRGHTLTLSGYAASGGVRGAIAETAESVIHDQLDPAQRTIARQIFLQLTELGEDEAAPDTRRRVTLDELAARPEDVLPVREVLTLLADARLITTEGDAAEVAHEALIREWPTLREWLAEDREGLRARRRLTEATHEWSLAKQDEGLLYRGARLAQALEWSAAHPGVMTPPEQAFLAASQALAEREQREAEDRRQRELEAARQVADAAQKLAEAETRRSAETSRTAAQLRRRALYLAVAFVLALVLAGSTLFYGARAERAAEAALRESQLAFSRELIAAALGSLAVDPERSLLLALEAVSVTQSAEMPLTPDIEDALHRAIWAQAPGQEWIRITTPGPAFDTAISADGKRLAANGEAGRAHIWDAFTGRMQVAMEGHSGQVQAVAFSPDGRFLATASRDNTATIWSTGTGRARATLSPHDGIVNDVSFSFDGAMLATGGSDQSAKVWSLTFETSRSLPAVTAALVLEVTTDYAVTAVALSPDGARLATAQQEGAVVLWDIAGSGRVLLVGSHDGVADLAFSPDGQRLTTAGNDHTILVYDAATGEVVFTLAEHTGPVTAVAYSPDGSRLASAGRDGATIIWDAASGQALYTLFGSGAGLNGLAFSADGARLVTAGDDGLAVYVMRPDELIALGQYRLTRSFTREECQKYLHQTDACPQPLPTSTVATLPPSTR